MPRLQSPRKRLIFQFTTSHGGRHNHCYLLSILLSFNSRPHTEVDCINRYIKNTILLSIHDLTRRSTDIKIVMQTKEQTFNSRPHTEVDLGQRMWRRHDKTFQFTTSHGGRPDDVDDEDVERVFQFTTSHGGRRCMEKWWKLGSGSFNSRPHTEVDTLEEALKTPKITFQFTTSHGGRPTEPYEPTLEEVFQFTTSHGGRL